MIERYSAKKHYKAIASWYHARDLEAPPVDTLPDVGFVVDGKVAGWLARTDGSTAIIEDYISNPHTTASTRARAVELLTATLLDAGQMFGYRRVICLVSIEKHQTLAHKYNLKETGQQVFILEDSDEQELDVDTEY